MNPLSLIRGLLPLIAFSVRLAESPITGSRRRALGAWPLPDQLAITRPRWPPKIINLISAGLYLC